MQIKVSARHGHLSPASQSKIETKVSRLTRYFDRVTALNVTVDYEWIDQRTGKPLVQRNGFRESAVFVASLPIQQPIDLARFQVVEQLATAIVDSMQADW